MEPKHLFTENLVGFLGVKIKIEGVVKSSEKLASGLEVFIIIIFYNEPDSYFEIISKVLNMF